MAAISFTALPAEIHGNIAKQCENNDLINLCLTSKWVKERCLHILYRHVNLHSYVPLGESAEDRGVRLGQDKRQQQFVRTLLNHPEYGKHIRTLTTRLHTPSQDLASEEDLWPVMHSLTRVLTLDIMARADENTNHETVLKKDLSNQLFQSVISVKLGGEMRYHLAKSILATINPAILRNLFLNLVNQRCAYVGRPDERDSHENGRIIAFDGTSGLLSTLTGRCTALRRLTLRRITQYRHYPFWHAAAEEASYAESASFIHSVQGTLEYLMFDQIRRPRFKCELKLVDWTHPVLSIKDERFLKHIFPALVSGKWPCLTMIMLRGVRGPTALEKELKAILGRETTVEVRDYAHHRFCQNHGS